MPSALHYIPPTDPERSNFTSEVRRERQARRDIYLKAIEYYEGKHDPQLIVDEGEPNDNTTYNMVRITCDRTVQFLVPEMPIFITDPESLKDTEEEIYLKRAFEANGGLSKLVKLATRGFLSGHNFVRVKPVPEAKKDLPNQYPSIILLDPLSVTVFWSAEDDGHVLWYESRYAVGETVIIQDYVHEDNDTWTIRTYEQVSTNKTKKIFQTVSTHGRKHTYLDRVEFEVGNFVLKGEIAKHTSSIPPIVEWEHQPHPNHRYGLSEFNQQELQDMINRVNSTLQKIVRENGDPKDVILGADLDDVEVGGNIITIAQAGATIKRLELKGDFAGIRSVLDKLVEIYLAVSRVVLLKGEAKDLQRVTNAAVRTLFLDALAKNEILRSTYGHGLRSICKLLLVFAYVDNKVPTNPEDLQIDVQFATPLPTDMKEIADVNAIALAGGYMTRQTAATRLNLNWSFEKTVKEQERLEDVKHQKEQLAMEAEARPDTSEGQAGSNRGLTDQ